ncbi:MULTISPECIES: 7-carboxy-7-deazaguanine synthase QueE [Streptomycetaceae]|uniref:7-carboxy-7-deazaguanine synthase n=1 Tax=Streptantibioticus cattleyicolor (strain ATCC 35852 / DSM 46488 / JCM 4925 / NBRC 14057 / NRRL 8057) TaxID=1003195 RepID=F8JT13_STREN|nr:MULTISPECIES: 7-carboxy-7-deazaguanine synthase QueE [Streptomycetaceae]AEW92948.1 radical SAM domain-containing protein [Streptantibioticus cattleyicolor NRRL 8057 = DSM 46488]MYS57695.1 4Fe-4S cluster-binding domain-containing protein [Streptomyces sp. SID5468]CCB73309.1 Radical SAM [Streptantibioticus cattleyicolor NRRL 8057 = DSM 46488]
MSGPTLVVAEVFGPTVQGEGPSTGRRAAFIRLGGCNLTCSWCDTPYTWDATRYDLRTQLTRQPTADIAARALEGAPAVVVITGGEPLLHQHQPGWLDLLDRLADAGVDIEIETNGTIAPTPLTTAWATRFNVSPKLASAGDRESRRIREDAIHALRDTGQATFKYVCASAEDVTETEKWVQALGIPPEQVWIMPRGTDAATIGRHLAVIADPAIRAGYNLTTRLHVLTWGNERAR